MKKQTQKMLAVFAIIALMFGLIPMSVSRAAGITFSVESKNAKVGETVSVSMNLDGDFLASAITEKISFDTSKLEVISVKTEEVYNNAEAKSSDDMCIKMYSNETDANKNGYITVTIGATGLIEFNSGKVVTIEFKAKENVAGTQLLSLDSEVIDAVDSNGKDVQVQAQSGLLKIVVPVTEVKLDKTQLNLNVDDTEILTPTILPENTTEDKTITWTSSDSSIAKVENGKVTAVAPGEATITAKVGDKTATCKVTVKAPLKDISLDKTTTSILKGKTDTISVTYNPANTTDSKNVTWTSSDNSVAKVENGKITAVKEGTATITAKVGDKTATCTVTVKEKKLESISIDKDFDLALGEEKTLVLTYKPEDTTDSIDVIWSSSDDSIVKVEDGKVTALKVGEATITAKVGDKIETVKITVPEVLLESIDAKLDTDKLEVEGTANIVVTLNPENITEEVKTTFKSSDDKIVKVDENGKVTALKTGKATVTVKVNDKFEKNVEIEVLEKTVEETKTEEENKTNINSDVPKTGDIAVGAFVVLMIISMAGAVFIYRKKLSK